MKQRKQRIRHAVPLRKIAEKTGLSLKHVWRIVNHKEQYSKESAQKVAVAKKELQRERLTSPNIGTRKAA